MLNIHKSWSDDELRLVPPIQIAADHLRNPFAADGLPIDRTKESKRFDLARRWSNLVWNSAPPTPAAHDMADPLDALLDALDATPKLFEPVFKDGKLVAVHPIGVDPKNEAAVAEWEAGAIAMHKDQKIITLPAKPGDAIRLRRGDEPPEIPKFEDSELARKQRARVVRGD